MRAVEQGAVAVRNKQNHRMLLHLVKDDVSATLCGRYKLDRIEPEDLELAETTPMCKVCRATADAKLGKVA
jgi:hypothetical protein